MAEERNGVDLSSFIEQNGKWFPANLDSRASSKRDGSKDCPFVAGIYPTMPEEKVAKEISTQLRGITVGMDV